MLYCIRKPIAAAMLMILGTHLCLPAACYALTSGPAQPEMKNFEPAGTADLVDPFTGDLTYNIPLLDAGGYPVNIAYHSGSGMDEEASWVGLGWSLNPGVIDRQMRGLPDDFNGSGDDGDRITKELHLRNDITAGVDFSFSPEVFGLRAGNVLNSGVQADVFYNNKRGLGVQLGFHADAPLLSNAAATAGTNTAGLSAAAGLRLNSQQGASFNPAINFSITASSLSGTEKNTSRLSLGGSFQSRAGLQAITLAESFQNEKIYKETQKENFSRTFEQALASSSVSYAAQTFLPETQADYFNQSYAVAPQFGPEAWGFFAGLQLTGHYCMQKVANPVASYHAYGFMHGNDGKDDKQAVMDFNREKDVPYFDGVPNLPVPVATPDLFMVHAQDGSGQYRAYLGGTGIFSDHDAGNTAVSASLGIEAGAGAGFKTGADLQASLSRTVTTKWKTGNKLLFRDDNKYDAYGNFTGAADGNYTGYESVYFKRVGEQVPDDNGIYDNVKENIPVKVATQGNQDGAVATNMLSANDNSQTALTQKITRTAREVRNNTFSYLDNRQVKTAGLNKSIKDYFQLAGGFKPFLGSCKGNGIEVMQPYKKSHHIGEITITDENGGRKIYGIPAYTTYQEDVSFSIGKNDNATDRNRGLVNYTAGDASVDNKNGIDHYYCKEMIPGYAHSFLLTGIVSPDYTDLTGDGITDDDLGTAIKFNYWRKTDRYQWRTPYAAWKANYNEGLMSDKTDDRGNYSYGRKELWYLHSIESKTTVAVFETGDRQDALGADAAGNQDNDLSNRQQYLKTIKLYSKADWYKNTEAAVPLKTVHFVYDYSLFGDEQDIKNGVPNNTQKLVVADANMIANQGGKLTLKKIYFTYQGNTTGSLHPYEFQYAANAGYAWRQYDRWGNYKNAATDNPAGITNDYYTYSSQDKTKADANAALWQLSFIKTPAGGVIQVQYEADDYMYVQNRKAMQMYPMAGLGSNVKQNTAYFEGDKIYVQLPEPLQSDEELRAKYFDGGVNDYSRNLFFKALVKLKDREEKYDYVSGYAAIDNIKTDVKLATGYNDVAEIKVKKIKGESVTTDYHPIAKAAWQFMRLNTPGLVYPGYNVRDDLAPVQFVKALVGAITSLTELLAPFDTRAQIKKLAPAIDLNKSWIRLDAATNPTQKKDGKDYYAKLGGGSRVKEVSVSDEWNSMVQSDAETASYGMVYDYTTTMKLPNGEEVMASSGVASYEPMIGNEENPFHQPNNYQQKINVGPDNAFFIDDPLCESYFPAAGVGYSSVTIKNKGADGQVGTAGYILNEFYTEKDFPTAVSHTPIDAKSFGGAGILQLLNIKKNNSRVVSQGYTVELNDMHGKPKSEKIIDRAGNELSSVYYFYKTVNPNAAEQTLNNEATVLQADGSVSNTVIGRDIEMYTDMRSQTSITAGVNVMVNVDAVYLLFAIIPIPVVLPLPNASYAGFRSASTVKVIQLFGIADKIVKRQNGSQITTENLARDAGTGGILLTRTQNEFDDPVYHFSYPAHWMYEGMGQAYKNLGLIIRNFSATDGNITASAATGLLVSGDELLVSNKEKENKKYWINDVGTGGITRLVLIDENGAPVSFTGDANIIRSGRRNMQGTVTGNLVSLSNPLKNGKLDISVFTRILDANGSTYNDEWAIDEKNIIKTVQTCPDGYTTDFFDRCYKDVEVIADPSYTTNTTVIRQMNNLYGTCGTFLTNLHNAYSVAGAADPAGTRKVLLNTGGTWQNGTTNCGTGTAGETDGPLNRSGIWLAERKNNNYYNQWVGIKAKMFISRFDVNNKSADGKTGYLFLGFGSQHSIEVRIDNVLVAARNRNADNGLGSPMRTWRIKPISISLDQQHEIFIRVKNEVPGSEAVIGVELYNNTYEQLQASGCVYESCLPCNFCSSCRVNSNTSINQLCAGKPYANAVWSTKCLTGKRFNYHASANGNILNDFAPVCKGTLFTGNDCNLKCRFINRIYAQKVVSHVCAQPVGQVFNPYTTGLLGNWRLQQSFAYHTDREHRQPYIKPGDPDVIGKTDIRKSGAYTDFSAFWKYTDQWLPQSRQVPQDADWVRANEVTAYNNHGQEIENRDALNRYNAALFGYLQSTVTAVASNARYTDIAYDGFEDYNFNSDNCNAADTCNLDGHFSIRAMSQRFPTSITPDNTYSHTGRYSLKITAEAPEASIVRSVLTEPANVKYSIRGNSFLFNSGSIIKGFEPKAGKKYMLSAWIKDDGDNVQQGPALETAKAAVEVTTGGQVFYTVKAGPRIEGWRKVETVFIIPVAATDIKIKFRPGNATAWFDDIRIQPFDGQLKTYAYDNRSMRLWAELDENNFAGFYEYNDEGLLIRIKKETEKGIMTIKEARSTYSMKR